ncbi:MAG TPA: SRPBCC family protein [Microlunatus sp.]
MSPTPTGEVRRTPAGRDLVLVRDLAGSIDDAWASLTDSERTGRWFASWTGDGRVGGAITLTLVAEEGTPTSQATIEACEPPTRLAVRAEDAAGGWELEAILEPLSSNRTRLTFVHHLADADRAEQIGPGWEYYLDRLLASRADGPMPVFDDYWPSMGPYYADRDREG